LIRFLKDLAWNSGKKFYKDACPQLAAAITYYAVFSIFPFTIFAASVAGLLMDEEAQANLVDEILKWVPLDEVEARSDIETAIDSLTGSTARVAGLIGLLTLLWSASSMFNSVRRALNIIFQDPEYRRPWVPQKLIDLGLVLGLGLFFIASLFGSTLLTLGRRRSDDFAWPGDLSGGIIWNVLEFAVPAALAFVGFTILYLIAPSRPRRIVDVWPGALFAALSFQAAVILFGVYVQRFADYSAIYGSLATVMLFLFWVFLSGQIMLAGAEIASVYPRVRSGGTRQEGMAGLSVPLRKQITDAVLSLFVKPPPTGNP
jgi:membrane protein